VYLAAILIPCGATLMNMRMVKAVESRRMICSGSLGVITVTIGTMEGQRLRHLASRHHHGMILKNLKSNGSV
jgi:hypothetical protein